MSRRPNYYPPRGYRGANNRGRSNYFNNNSYRSVFARENQLPQNQLPHTRQNLPDPLDAIFNRFTSVRRNNAACVEIDDTQPEVDTSINTSIITDPLSIDASDLVLIDEDPMPIEIQKEKPQQKLEDDDDEIMIIEHKSVESDAQPSYTTLSEDDDEITIIKEIPGTSQSAPNLLESSKEEAPTNYTDQIAIGLKTAAMEDSLVKGTVQQYQRFVRHWEVISEPKESTSDITNVFRVCSYNILCQDTIERTKYLYRHLKDYEFPLLWENRWPLLAQNLTHINADIFALQEVQESHFNGYINILMASQGYKSMWTKKTGQTSVDGCAIFYKEAKFDYVFSRQIHYYVGPETILDKPQIGQILRLRCKKTKKEIVVTNTHIIFNMKRGDIKLAQLSILFAHIHKEMKEHGDAPLIIMGDFNMDPLSYLYTFVIRGSLFLKGLGRANLACVRDKTNYNIIDTTQILPSSLNIGRNSIFIENSEQKIIVANDTITHPFELWTAYAPLSNSPKNEETISTYHVDKGTPDFIFYSVKKKVFKGDVSFFLQKMVNPNNRTTIVDNLFHSAFGMPTAHNLKKKDKRNLPRKCAVVRQSLTTHGVEKIELRFVSYRSIGDENCGDKGFFDEIGQFLKEQLKTDNTASTNANSDIRSNTTPFSISTRSSEAQSSTHHNKSCTESQTLKAIPSLERLTKYYDKMTAKTNDAQYRVLRKANKDVLGDAQKTLIDGGVPMGNLLERIQMLNDIELDEVKK